MVRRSPQKRNNKAGSSGPAKGNNTQSNEASTQAAVNWHSTSAATPSLAPESEPWTPTGHKSEWSAAARSPIRSPTKSLEQQVSSLQAQREAADADLWNARVELQDHAQQKEADRERIAKLTAELTRLRSEYEHDSQALDELRSREEELQSDLERERAKAARDRQIVRQQLEDRDGFIENLQSQLDELREELKTTSRSAAFLRQQNADDTSADISSGAGDITSMTIDSDINVGPPEPSEVPQTVGANELLSQTHQARQQRSLRAALQKQRLENMQLKQQLADLRGISVARWEEENQQNSDREQFVEETSQPSKTLESSSEFFMDSSLSEVPQIPAGVPLSEDLVEEEQPQRDTNHPNLAVIPEKELSEVRKNHSEVANLDTLSAELRKKYDAQVVSSEELEALRNPNMDFLDLQANAFDHKLVPIKEYEQMRNTQATSAKLKLTDKELKLAYELLRGHCRSKSKVHSHVLQDLARNQALGLSPDVSHYYGETSRDFSVSPTRSTGRRHRTKSRSSSVSDTESQIDEAQTLPDGVGVALRQIAQNHGYELVSDTVAASRELAHRHGLATVPLENLAHISDSKIVLGGPVPSSLQTKDVMLSLSREEVERIQEQLGETAKISKEKLSELERRAYTPNSADITEQAAALGLAVLPLEAVAEMKGQLRQRTIPDASTVAAMAEKAGLRVIPQHPTLDELREMAPDDALLVERDTWAALEYPEPATLRRLAKAHGLAVLPEEEIKRLQSKMADGSESVVASNTKPPLDQLSVDQVREAAQAHDLVVLSADDYREILASRQMRDFSHLPMAARTEHFEKLIKSSREARPSATSPRGSPSASSLGSLSDRITRLGFVPVEQEEYQRLLASQKVYEPTKSDILRSAKHFGLAVMSIEDALRLRSSHWNSPSKNSRDGSVSASGSGSPISHLNSGNSGSSLKSDMRNDTDENEFEGFTAVPTEYLTALRRIVEHPTRSDIEKLSCKAGLSLDTTTTLTDDEVIHRAKQLGLVVPPSKENLSELARTEGYVEPLNNNEIVARAKELGLSEPLSKEELLEEAKSLGLVEPLSEVELFEKARSLGLVEPLTHSEIIEQAKAQGLVEPLNDDQICEKARNLGLIDKLTDDEILAQAENLGHVKPLTDAQIRERGLILGLVEPMSDTQVVETAKRLGLVQPLSEEELKAKARALGLSEPPTELETLEHGKQLGLVHPMSDSEIIAKAKTLGLSEPLNELQIREEGKALGLIEPYDECQILEHAKSIGLVEPLADEAIVAKALSLGLIHEPSDSEVLKKAKSLGLTEPLTHKDLVQKAKASGLVPAPSDSEILAKAKTLGFTEQKSDPEILDYATRHLGVTQPPSEKEIISKAQQLGLAFPLSEDQLLKSAKSKGLVEPYTEAQIRHAAKKLGLVEPYSDNQIRDAAKKLGLTEPLKESELIKKAKSKGLVEPYSDTQIRDAAKKLGLTEPLTESELFKKAKSRGLVESYTDTQIRDAAKKLGLVEPPNERELADAAKAKGLEPFSDSQIREAAKKLGMIEPLSESQIIHAAKTKGLTEPLTEPEILKLAKARGFTKPLTDTEIMEAGKSHGLIEPLTKSQLIDAAKAHGLVEPPTLHDKKMIVQQHGPVVPDSDPEVIAGAKQLGLVEPLTDDEVVQKPKDAENHVTYQCKDAQSGAPKGSDPFKANSPMIGSFDDMPEKEGTVVPPLRDTRAMVDHDVMSPDRAESYSNRTSEVPSSVAAAAIGYRGSIRAQPNAPVTEAPLTRNLVDSPTSASPKGQKQDVIPPPIPERIRTDRGRSSSFTKTSDIPLLAPAPLSELGDGSRGDPFVVYGPEGPGKLTSSGLPQHLGESPIRGSSVRSNVRQYDSTAVPRSPTRGTSRSTTSGSLRVQQTKATAAREPRSNTRTAEAFNLPLPRSNSCHPHGTQSRYAGSLVESLGSSWAVETINGEAAELNISQIVVGEVLHKYTTGFNFEGITGGRHKRYFWFRPESMTLYWHRENPHFLAGFYTPAKCITVIGVEEIPDRNPLPAGIFHRSILIKGRERDLRVTCSTAARHQVWFSSLRYVLAERDQPSHAK